MGDLTKFEEEVLGVLDVSSEKTFGEIETALGVQGNNFVMKIAVSTAIDSLLRRRFVVKISRLTGYNNTKYTLATQLA